MEIFQVEKVKQNKSGFDACIMLFNFNYQDEEYLLCFLDRNLNSLLIFCKITLIKFNFKEFQMKIRSAKSKINYI